MAFSYVPYGTQGIIPEQIFGVQQSQTDAGPAPASSANNTTPGTQETAAPMSGTPHVAISWVGVLLALVILRILYEFSE